MFMFQVNIGKQLRRMLDMEDSKIGYIAHVRWRW